MGEEIEPAGAVSASPQDKIEEIQKDGDDGVDNLNEEVAEIDLEDKDDNQKETEGEEEEQRCPHLHQANPDKFKAKIFLDAKCMQCVGAMKQPKKGYENRKGQGKAKKGKKGTKGGGGQSIPEDNGIWICASCANIGCGRDSPYKHALAHSNSGSKHHIAIQWEPRTLMVWCYECDDEVFPDESVPYKNLRNVLTILRGGIPEPSQNTLRKEQDAASRKEKRKQDKLLQQLDKKNNKQSQKQKQKSQDYNFESSSSSTYGGDTSAAKGVKGLANLGNTCFFNSVLQNLSHTRVLLDYYLGKENASRREVTGNMNLAMQETVNLMWTEGKGSKLSPNALFSAIASKFTMFRRKQQQDAHELLCCLFDGLSSEGKSGFVKESFGGRLSSTVTCHECQTPSRTYEPFFILSLPIPLENAQPKAQAQVQASYEPPRSDVKLSAAKQRRLEKRQLKKLLQEQTEDEDLSPTSVPLPDSPATPSPSLADEIEKEKDGDNKKDEEPKQETKEETKEEVKEEVKQEETKEEKKEETQEEIKEETTEEKKEEPKEEAKEEVKEELKEEPKEEPKGEPKEEPKEEKKEETKEVGEIKPNKVPTKQKETRNKENNNNLNNIKVKGKKLTPGPVELRQWNGEPIKPAKGSLSILDCMLAFTDPEVLEGKNAFGCSTCTKLRYGDKTDEELQDEMEEELTAESETEEEKTEEVDSKANDDAKENGTEEKDSETKEDGKENSETSTEEKKRVETTAAKGKEKKKEETKKKGKEEKITKKSPLVTCTATKQLLLDTPPPPVLVLHLKRFMQFKNSFQKIGKMVSFPPSLNLNAFFAPTPATTDNTTNTNNNNTENNTNNTNNNNLYEYKLAGIVEHSGSMAGGHYVAYFHNDADDKWYYASDTHVSVSSLEHALKSEAYLLFYHKVN